MKELSCYNIFDHCIGCLVAKEGIKTKISFLRKLFFEINFIKPYFKQK